MENPGTREGPVVLYSGHGNTEDLGCLLIGHSSEITKLHDLRLRGMLERQLIEDFMDGDQLLVRFFGLNMGLMELGSFEPTAMTIRCFTTCTINQNAAHRFSRCRKKVGAICKPLTGRRNQTQPGLMNKRGRLERLTWQFLRQLARGQRTQLFIHNREQLLRGIRVSLFDGIQ